MWQANESEKLATCKLVNEDSDLNIYVGVALEILYDELMVETME